MLEPSERPASTTPSLRRWSSTDWPRRARSACTCDTDQQTDVLTWAPKWPLALLCAYWPAHYSPLLRPRSARASVAGFQMKIAVSPSGKSNQVLTTLVRLVWGQESNLCVSSCRECTSDWRDILPSCCHDHLWKELLGVSRAKSATSVLRARCRDASHCRVLCLWLSSSASCPASSTVETDKPSCRLRLHG